jgi:hypothetical protein
LLSARTAADGFEMLALHDVQVVVCYPPHMPEADTGFLERVKKLHPAVLRIVLSGVDAAVQPEAPGRGHRRADLVADADAAHAFQRASLGAAFLRYWEGGEKSPESHPVLDAVKPAPVRVT